MIREWQEISPRSTPSVGEQALAIAGLAKVGLPIANGSWIATASLFSTESIARMDAVFQRPGDCEACTKELQDLFSNEPFAPLAKDSIQKFLSDHPWKDILLAVSLPSGLSIPTKLTPGIRVGADLQAVESAMRRILGAIFTVETVEAARHLKIDFRSAGGALLLWNATDLNLVGSVSTCNPTSKNPFELQLDARPYESQSLVELGSRYLLQRDALSQNLRIKRAVFAHLRHSGGAPRLTQDQVRMLGHLALLAAESAHRPQRITWMLQHGRLQVIAAEPEVSPTQFFPFKGSLLDISERERQAVKNAPAIPQWNLASHAPFTPFGMTLDHLIQQTMNQGVGFYQLPLPMVICRYINGYRFQLALERESGWLDRLAGHLRKSSFEDLQTTLKREHAPKFLELLRALANQNIRERPLPEVRELLEHAVRILLKFVADTSEIRGHLLLRAEQDPRLDSQPLRAVSTLADKFRQAGLTEALRQSSSWDQFAPHVLARETGEYLLQEMRHLQDDYGYLWRDGEPLDPGAPEDPALLLYYLQRLGGEEAVSFPEATEKENESFSLSRLDHLLYRGISMLRGLLLEIGERMTALQMFPVPDDIFYVTYEEVLSLSNLSEIHSDYQRMLNALILDRKRSSASWKQYFPPSGLPLSEEGTTLDFIHSGQELVPGTAEGISRVIRRSVDLMRIQPGEIILCTHVHETWLPLLPSAAGLVIDQTGTSAAIRNELRARNLPTLCAMIDASRRVREGSRVRIDTSTGELRVLNP